MTVAQAVTVGSCQGKRRYRRSVIAKRALRRAQTFLGGPAMNAYHCPGCGYWHVGHKPPWMRS